MTNYQDIQAFLYQEVRHLDDKEWDQWLKFYDEDCVFWMPGWDDEDELTKDPQTEISLIYYPNKGGLEDRVFRIKTERSSASMPEPRTCHYISNVEVLEESEEQLKIRFNWNTLSFRYKTTDSYFGVSFYTLKKNEDSLLIVNKKVIIKNDYIRQVLDVYHI
ncbi:benzoate 1,2-dioxygenase small subunit [Pedobacter sp. PLR]|uniref:benzoate 1,2-dioxygenase small subunit n=1 Tax=Pedobacter sp. PLR TaxID=2994465 RepID=UPI0022463727|nr:benzoate 1,2-dioxygenase small subunit [Pedobacter sp. PLR]MCX2452306.1 benzoate 1,2-dioxygenase small subunit [Pedobacter sp. PLR]